MRAFVKAPGAHADEIGELRRPNSDLVQIVIVGASLTALLVLAVFLVNRESSSAVASDAEIAILSESTMSAAAGVLNATNFAVVLAANEADPEVLGDATKGADKAADELSSRLGRLISAMSPAGRDPVEQAYRRFELTTGEALDALHLVDIEEWSKLLADQSRSYEELVKALTEIRDTRTAEILIAGEGVGQAAEAVRFLVVFLIPLGIMVAVWKSTRRSAAQRILTEELRHEREASRSKDAFIADVSHELRTPLTGIYGFASALEDDDAGLSESSRELVGLIVTEAAELTRMVDDLVAAGRIDAEAILYDIGPIELTPVIQEVLRPFRRRGISVEVDDISISVMADRMRLRQLLRNLVSNAAKHGGSEIAVTAYSRQALGVIEVIDNGPGVSAEVEERLFHRYVHSDGTAVLEGSVGLGLAIARSFAQDMGGELNYLRVDDLTIFQVILPLVTGDGTVIPESELSVVSS
ncbi:MAG: sensor histidine kinase [Acidimicrobiia bacterium]